MRRNSIMRNPLQIPTLIILFSLTLGIAPAPEPAIGPGEVLAQMMKKGEMYAAPGAPHALIDKLTGNWKTTTVVMGMEAEIGFSENVMLLDGRFLEMNYKGLFVGLELKGKVILGYDNYKHKFTAVFIDNLNTSLRTAEGVLDHSGTVLSLWGTMDEWLTDEHDKPVLYIFKFLDPNKILFEVHDLSLTTANTKIVEVTYDKE